MRALNRLLALGRYKAVRRSAYGRYELHRFSSCAIADAGGGSIEQLGSLCRWCGGPARWWYVICHDADCYERTAPQGPFCGLDCYDAMEGRLP